MIQTDNRIVIFGTGGHAKSVISIIEAEAKWKIHGLLVDPEFKNAENSILGYEIIGSRSNFLELSQAEITRGFVAVGDNHLRAKITVEMESNGIHLTHIIHPSAVIMTNLEIGRGSMIHAQAVVGASSRIGNHSIISSMVTIGHDSHIGEYAHITPGVCIGGGATIGDFSFLGLGSVILPNVKVGRNVKIGANSVIHKDVDDNTVVVGNPARVIKRNIPF